MKIVKPISVKVVGTTQPLLPNVFTLTEFIAYQAKLSGAQDDLSNHKKLIKYLIDNKHWSPFQMVNINVEIRAPRDITRQIIRHRSFTFQEFSQRYAEVDTFCLRDIRRADPKNRQNSINNFSYADKKAFQEDCRRILSQAKDMYDYWSDQGAAKECVRVLLPEGLTMSHLYVNGTVREWIHYLDVREANGTQLEHIWVANDVREVLNKIEPDLFPLENLNG